MLGAAVVAILEKSAHSTAVHRSSESWLAAKRRLGLRKEVCLPLGTDGSRSGNPAQETNF